MHMDYIVLGQLLTDDIIYTGKKSCCNLLGGAAYALAGIRYWSEKLGVCCGIGSDFYAMHGEWIHNQGIDMRGTQERAVRSPHTRCVYTESEERVESVIPGTADLASMMPAIRDIPDCYSNCKGVYVYLGSDPLYWEELAAWKEHKSAVLLWELRGADAKPENRDAFRRYLAAADILSINLAEARQLTGKEVPERCLEELLNLGADNVFLHMGAAGSYAASQEICWHVLPWQVDVVDVTGGGNSASGGFLAGFCESGGDLRQAGICGNVSASFVLEQFGLPEQIRAEEMKRAAERAEQIQVQRIY